MAQYALVILLALYVLNRAEEPMEHFTPQALLTEIILPGILVVASLGTTAGLFERRAWAFPAEVVRLVTLFGGAVAYAAGTRYLPVVLPAAAIGLAASLGWLARYRNLFATKSEPFAAEAGA